ncbi:hypothetical protein [Limnofasciculus baicalensis]|uniref:Uncharacterized protein n=1 Tax=Limnofasciculus baicalensis BBK-W-15 TaxID=2699891 RepID=A0AAE3KMW5_9CYAN|nr:hypothetical protein [Limnofasciculus baicalensis]MCP2728023.1 hypothetical protein [Limnofasciculus baicalensis BBK-W-15]
MGSRRHISRKDISASAFTPKPKPPILQTRPFSNGKHARSSELLKTDILQTRPFSDPAQKSSGAEKQPPTPEALEKVAAFGYNGASIPLFAPAPFAPIQAQLTIGEPGDKYEEEADTVAHQVVDKINAPAQYKGGATAVGCEEMGEEEGEMQKPEAGSLQRVEISEQHPKSSHKDATTKATSSPGKILQRQVLSKIASGENEQGITWILDVTIGGRTPSPFSGTMGAHSTAWIAHIDAVRRMLVNTELAEGAKYLIELAEKELTSPLLELKKFVDEQHQKKIDDAETILKQSIDNLKKEIAPKIEEKKEIETEIEDKEEIETEIEDREEIETGINVVQIKQLIRKLIDSYLTYVNYLPMSTVKGGDPGGHGEGSARGDINTFEYVSANVTLAGDKDLPAQLSQEIQTLGSKGIQGQIKAGAKKKFQFNNEKEKLDEAQLTKDLIETLWTLFAAETPEIFAQGLEQKNRVLVWQRSLQNFLHTIMSAYPYTYDFTKMQTKESQEVGLKYALEEAKIPQDYEELKNLLPVAEEEALIRESHDEVTPSDLKQSGSGFMATILLDEEGIVGDVNLIGAVEMIGRTKSPFSGTMGAHTTAWAAHLDAVRNILTGKNVAKAITTLKSKAEEAMKDEGLDFSHKIDEKHQVYLVLAYNDLKEKNNLVDSQQKSDIDRQVNFLEEYIFTYLTFVNFLPLSTISIGSVPGGKKEGQHRTFLLKYEQLGEKVFGNGSTENKQQILEQHLLGLFDKSGLNDFPPLLGAREEVNFKEYTGEDFTKEHGLFAKINPEKGKKSPNKKQVAYKRFYKTILEAYPRAVADSGLVKGKEDLIETEENDSIAKEVWSSSKEDIVTNEKDELEEILHQNNCLINAIKKAAFEEDSQVTEEELLEIRLRIGQIGTMLFARERTISIICDVLNINNGIVVIYKDRPSEDFGDTSSNPIMIQHTGAAHFVPYTDLMEVALPESEKEINDMGESEEINDIEENSLREDNKKRALKDEDLEDEELEDKKTVKKIKKD